MSSCEVNFRLGKFQSADWRCFSRLDCRTLAKHVIVSVGFSRLACVNPTLDFMAWAQRSRTVRPLLARKLSLCDYKPPLIQALFFCGVAGERLMGWKKTLAQRYGSRSPRCFCLLELNVLGLLSPLLALTFVIGPVTTVCTFWYISQCLNQCLVSFCRKQTGIWPWIWDMFVINSHVKETNRSHFQIELRFIFNREQGLSSAPSMALPSPLW